MSVAIAVAIVWTSTALSYRTDWPIGSFVTAIAAAAYGVSRWVHPVARWARSSKHVFAP